MELLKEFAPEFAQHQMNNKIPMITFEIGFLGLKFSLLRILITIPVFILIGIIMGKYFEKKNCTINKV